MKFTLTTFILAVFTFTVYGQIFEKGSIITQHYHTISDVQIKKLSVSESLQSITYINKNGKEQSPNIATIKSYTRGNDVFTRIYFEGKMLLVNQVTMGNKLNLYETETKGTKTYYVEKVFDELIKVPHSNNIFKKTMSEFLESSPLISEKIKSQELMDIVEIVSLYNKN